MITVRIGTEERKDAAIKERWIAQQIRKRRKDEQPVCIQIIIHEGDVRLTLSSGDCSNTGGGTRKPNIKEREIIKLWKERELDEKEINAGMIISFLRQFRQYV